MKQSCATFMNKAQQKWMRDFAAGGLINQDSIATHKAVAFVRAVFVCPYILPYWFLPPPNSYFWWTVGLQGELFLSRLNDIKLTAESCSLSDTLIHQ